MQIPFARRGAAVFVVGLLGLSVSACGDSGAGPQSGSAGALPPVIAEVEDLDGSTFEINDAQPLVVNAPDPTKWTGEVADPSVAEFVPGRDDGSAVYNPGFFARGSGSTGASMTAPDGEVHNFEIVVK